MTAKKEPLTELANMNDLVLTTNIVENLCSIIWKIENFSAYPTDVYGKIESSTFQFSSTTWCLHLYPGGRNFKDNCVSIRLNMLSPKTEKAVRFAFGLKDKHNANIYEATGQGIFNRNKSSWGTADHMLNLDFLQAKKDKLLCHDVLTVSCDLTVWESSHKSSGHLDQRTSNKRVDIPTSSIPKGVEILLRNMKTLLTECKNCDVTLKVGNETFFAHKLVLAARSSVFSSMFEHDMEESISKVVSITDIESSVVSDLLQYIYLGSADDLTIDTLGLYVAADKYALLELKAQCADILKRNLSMDNACDIAVLANLHNDGMIIDSIKMFVRQNPALLSTEKWKNLAAQNTSLAYEITLTFVPPKS